MSKIRGALERQPSFCRHCPSPLCFHSIVFADRQITEDESEILRFGQDRRNEKDASKRLPHRCLSDLPLLSSAPREKDPRPVLGDIVNNSRNKGFIAKTLQQPPCDLTENELGTGVELFQDLIEKLSNPRESPSRTLDRRDEKIEDPPFCLWHQCGCYRRGVSGITSLAVTSASIR